MIRIGIAGYGNLGKGIECAVKQNPDMELVAIFTRRDPKSLKVATETASVAAMKDIVQWKDKIDVLILCGGSAKDLPEMTPALARDFNVVDSFDTHSKIPEHFDLVDKRAKETGHIAVISAGWDPGLFSLSRLYFSAILPQGESYTFWGKGVSQGHSDAVRRIPGVADCRQYTIPVPEAMDRVRKGENPLLTTREKHTRLCYVVTKEGADKGAIETAIKTMTDYFADYDTTVVFIDQETLNREHGGLPHGGSVIRSGSTGFSGECHQTVEFKLTLDSNPQFTSSVLVACARAAAKMHSRGITGCHTMLDIAPADLSPLTPEEMRKNLL